MKTRTWWRVNKEGSWINSVSAVAWTDTTITTCEHFLPGCYKTELIASSDGANYFTTEQEAIEYTHQTVGKKEITERLVWA